VEAREQIEVKTKLGKKACPNGKMSWQKSINLKLVLKSKPLLAEFITLNTKVLITRMKHKQSRSKTGL
jgi:hypothetical protein